jgi:CMP-N,N'-diacetyllegionaminic acid synthase
VSAVAIVLARGGSKGVPGKNAKALCGKPCIAWTIESALGAKRVSRVVVSTDDAGLAAISREYGAEVIARPAELASDAARVDDAARHAAGMMEGDRFVLLYGNVPVRPEGLIDGAVALLERTGCDSVQSYAPVGKFHPWWIARVDAESGAVRPWEGDVLNHGIFRRQDLPPAHIPDGGVIVVTRRALMLEIAGVRPGPHAFFGLDRRGVINPEGAVVDIDSPTDLLVAEAVLGQRVREGGPGARSSTRIRA